MSRTKQKYDAWNPGLTSEIPNRLMPSVTLYDPKNADIDYLTAKEAADFCGLKPQEMISFKVSRLLVHEILIRVTADLYVPDGPSYEELGLNLRSMARKILDDYALPRLQEIEQGYFQLRSEIEKTLAEILDRDVYGQEKIPANTDRVTFFSRLFRKEDKPVLAESTLPENLALSKWQVEADKTESELERACLLGLQTIVGGIVGQRGRLMADKDMVVRLASNWVCNSFGSQKIGAMIEPILISAANAEGYRLLPFQKKPFVMNVKGASGAGKSTIRPLQRELAERLGIRWEDFALVSPDYWRKFLLDYKSLGEDYKYAAMLTGQELEIIDKKLDRYMEAKAARGQMPHLLIDRFRFDSFISSPKQQADGRLLSRFGDTVFMFFMITPPPDTVERAWKRGIETGRYKAVDDLLYHNIEAYTGMPQLFFTWVHKKKQKIHFEFLDNSVPHGERPRTVAFGWNGKLTVLDVDCIRRLNRYQKINIDAQKPEDVLQKPSGPDDDILVDCIEKIPDVTFADPETLQILGRTQDGDCIYEVDAFFKNSALEKAFKKSSSPHKFHQSENDNSEAGRAMLDFDHEKKFTVGVWRRA